jgi:hypothetical protein
VSDPDLDAEFARIIAGWDAEAPDPLPRPAAPDPTDTVDDAVDDAGQADASEATSTVAATDRPGADPSSPERSPSDRAQPERSQAPHGSDPAAPPQRPAGPAGPSGLMELPIAPTTAHVWRGGATSRDDADGVVDDEDHFVPPSEIDLPSAETDPMFWAIVGGLVGGPLLLLYVLFFDRDGSGWWVVTALSMVVVGFVLLVLRGGSERDPFDDGTRV